MIHRVHFLRVLRDMAFAAAGFNLALHDAARATDRILR